MDKGKIRALASAIIARNQYPVKGTYGAFTSTPVEVTNYKCTFCGAFAYGHHRDDMEHSAECPVSLAQQILKELGED